MVCFVRALLALTYLCHVHSAPPLAMSSCMKNVCVEYLHFNVNIVFKQCASLRKSNFLSSISTVKVMQSKEYKKLKDVQKLCALHDDASALIDTLNSLHKCGTTPDECLKTMTMTLEHMNRMLSEHLSSCHQGQCFEEGSGRREKRFVDGMHKENCMKIPPLMNVAWAAEVVLKRFNHLKMMCR